MKLFQRDTDGLLHEVPADQVEALKASHRYSQEACVIQILFTPAEEAQRDAEEAIFEAITAQPPKPSPPTVPEMIAALVQRMDAIESRLAPTKG